MGDQTARRNLDTTGKESVMGEMTRNTIPKKVLTSVTLNSRFRSFWIRGPTWPSSYARGDKVW